MEIYPSILLLLFGVLQSLEFGFRAVSTSHTLDSRHGFVSRRDADEGCGPCTEKLEYALRNATSHTIIRLTEDQTIENFVLVEDLTNITIEADGSEGGVVIQCSERAGLAFINVSQLSIRNVTIDGCGFNGTDTERIVDILDDIVNIFFKIPRVVRIAVLIGHCENLTMESVTIKNTRGFGLVGINVIGTSLLQSVVFFNNTNPGVCDIDLLLNVNVSEVIDTDSRDNVGGAAVFIYFDYHDQTLYQGSHFNLDFHSCNFTFNGECSLLYLNVLRFPGRGDSRFITDAGYRLGGGGISLILTQQTYGVDVHTALSNFYNNSNLNLASFSRAYFIVLFTGVQDTHVTFKETLFDKSNVVFYSDVRLPNGMNYRPYDTERDTTVAFVSSEFVNSESVSSLLIYSDYYSTVGNLGEVVRVFLNKCTFVNNQALVGSAVFLYEYKLDGFSVGMQVFIRDSDFIANTISTFDEDATVTISQSAGIVDVRNMNLTFYGNCTFKDNDGTALRAQSTLIGVSGNITFLRNTGVNGGALHLVEYSYLIMNRNSSIYFVRNRARVGGGAIYVNENGLNSFLVGGFVDCFLHFSYDNFLVCEDCSDIDNYGVFIKFLGNEAQFSGSMVLGSALATCPWTASFRAEISNSSSSNSLFGFLNKNYPSVFSFDEPPLDPTLVRSVAATLIIDTLNSSLDNIEVFPGEVFYANISALDDFNNIISDVVSAFASADISIDFNVTITPVLGANRFAVLADNIPTTVPIKISGPENERVNLVIYSTDLAGRAQEQINITLSSCGFGFTFDLNEQVCACNPQLSEAGLGVTCNIETQRIIVPDGVWIGPVDQNQVVVHNCVFGYCRPGERNITIDTNNSRIDFDVQCDADMNRVGFLCGRCKDGYSAVLGSRRCKQCSNWYILLFPIFIAIGILTIVTITYLNITITTGLINGAIFYSNIVSIYGAILVPGETLTNGAAILISFPTLNLGFETCLHDKMTTLEKVWWQLSFPFYLFALMIITTLLARTKCWKYRESAGVNIIQAFATLLILCYISVLEVCFELVGFRRIFTIEGQLGVQWTSDPTLTYFGMQHGFLGFVAFLLIVVYIVPLPLFLMFPSLLYRNRYLSKFKPIYDAFWDPYMPKYRFFLGFRLIFRWIPFALALLINPPLNIFITNFLLIILLVLQLTVQPFRMKWKNYVDAIFLLNLVLLFLGSIYFWSIYGSASEADRRAVSRSGLGYINTFIALGFLLILAIFIHRIVLRSSKLRQLVGRCLSKLPLSNVSDTELTREIIDVNSDPASDVTTIRDSYTETSDGNKRPVSQQPTSSVVAISELREPLLECEDSYDLDPSTTIN